ncbi:glycosyltransferase [Lithospermum erythrorhizon]|uniref:Glycosyltransferase n=1 Tax=Lithospermum erythrorhizon TaxID=34254 RepID=A0AAV3Q3S0_LITER
MLNFSGNQQQSQPINFDVEHHHQQQNLSSPISKFKIFPLFRTDINTPTKSYITSRLCSWLLVAFLFQVLFIFLVTTNNTPNSQSPPSLNKHQQHDNKNKSINNGGRGECEYGNVYVYDLPPMFNKELLDHCDNLDPWSSRCNALSNDGFGPKATGLDQLVPGNLCPAWYWTDMYSAEVIYHSRMMGYKCRTSNPNNATGYYIPFYVGLSIGRYLWYNFTSKDRDRSSEMMLDWIKDQESWKLSNGSDHFIMLGRLTWDFRRLTDDDKEWGSKFAYMPLMKNVMKVTVERSIWDPLEVSVPYPTAFHPRSNVDILQWQGLIRARKRSSLFCFIGATRKKIKNDFRGVLMNYCKKETEKCKVVDCGVEKCYDGAPAILEGFLDSDFCFQPKGDGFTRRSFYDCMLAGSIPVYFWEKSFKDQYKWHLPNDARSYSVFIDHGVVRNNTGIIRSVLEKYSKDEIKKMRETIIGFMPRFLYSRYSGDLGSIKDAFDVAMDGILRKFKEQKEGKAIKS